MLYATIEMIQAGVKGQVRWVESLLGTSLLRFYFNHHVYERSQRSERTGRSPVELRLGKKHPHWLEMLGFTRFNKADYSLK